MPIIYWAVLGITTIGTGFLVLDKGAEQTVDNTQKAIVTGVGLLGLYACYKILVKK